MLSRCKHSCATPSHPQTHIHEPPVWMCFLSCTSGYILLIWSNKTLMMNTLGVTYFISLKKQLTKCRKGESVFYCRLFSSVVFIDCFLWGSRNIFNLMSSKTEKFVICYFSARVSFHSLPTLFVLTRSSFISSGPLLNPSFSLQCLFFTLLTRTRNFFYLFEPIFSFHIFPDLYFFTFALLNCPFSTCFDFLYFSF